MRSALALAEEGLREGILPVGAIVVSGDAIVGRGRKMLVSDPHFRHAEIEALRQAMGQRRTGPLTLYSTLEPCIMCFGTALHTLVARVVFALEDPGAGATAIDLKTLPRRHRGNLPEVVGGVLRDDAMTQMRSFITTTNSKYWSNPQVPLVALVNGSARPGARPEALRSDVAGVAPEDMD